MTASPSTTLANGGEADTQARVLGLLDASDYKRIDTHASIVFLGGDRVLKIKRAVKLPFLDYSTLEKRRLACEEELKVNAGNAPEIYRRVVAITRGDGGLEIGGAGTPVEWAVEMARFDETQTLDHIAAANAIDLPLALAMADTILQAHDKAPRAGGEAWLASIPDLIDGNTDKFHAVRDLDAAEIDRLDAASHDDVTRWQSLLRRRVEQGFVRRCHGDLHLANIALVNGRPLLFDAVEFDPSIATTDILYDLAFTLMDMIHFGQERAANALFNRYLCRRGGGSSRRSRPVAAVPVDAGGDTRQVLFTRSEQAAHGEAAFQEAKRYFDLARRLIMPEPPRLVAIGGLSGTGKSVLARGLAGLIAPPPGAVVIRSDVVRKRLFGVGEAARLPEAAYQADTTGRVYDAAVVDRGTSSRPGPFGRARCGLHSGDGAGCGSGYRTPAECCILRTVPDGRSCDPGDADRAASGRCLGRDAGGCGDAGDVCDGPCRLANGRCFQSARRDAAPRLCRRAGSRTDAGG